MRDVVRLSQCCDTASNWYGTFRGRVGYAMDRIMIYGTAGGAVSDVKVSSSALPWTSNTELGWAAGAGIEGAITDNLTAKVEYLFTDYGSTNCTVASCGSAPATSNSTRAWSALA